jgi:hypothetical protein
MHSKLARAPVFRLPPLNMRAYGAIFVVLFSAAAMFGENTSPVWAMVSWHTVGDQTQLHIAIQTASRNCEQSADSVITVLTTWPLAAGEAAHTVPLDQTIHVETGKNGTVSMFYGDAGEMAESADISFRSSRDSKILGDYVVKLKSGVQRRAASSANNARNPMASSLFGSALILLLRQGSRCGFSETANSPNLSWDWMHPSSSACLKGNIPSRLVATPVAIALGTRNFEFAPGGPQQC